MNKIIMLIKVILRNAIYSYNKLVSNKHKIPILSDEVKEYLNR